MISLPEKFEEFSEARRDGFIKAKELKESMTVMLYQIKNISLKTCC